MTSVNNKYGESGRRVIQKALEETHDPWRTIHELQNSLGLGSGKWESCISFLDELEIPRSEIFHTIMERMKFKLEKMFETLSEKDLIMILDMPEFTELIMMPELRSLIINLARHLSTIPKKYIQLLAKNDIIKELPIQMQRKAWEEDDFSFNKEMTKVCVEIRGDPTQLKQRNESLYRLKDLLGQSDILFSKFCRYCCRQANTVYRTALTLPTPPTSTTSTTSSTTTTMVAIPSTTNVLTVEHIAEIASWSSTIIDVIKLQGHGDMSKKYSKLCDLTFLIDSIKRQGFVDANRLLNIYQLVKVLISNQATELEKVYKVPIHVHSTILIKSTSSSMPPSSKPISNLKEASNSLNQTSKSMTTSKVKLEERPKKSMGGSKSSQPPSDTSKQSKLKKKKKVKRKRSTYDSDDEEEAEDSVSSADEEEEDLNEDLFGEDDDVEGVQGQSDSEDDGGSKRRKSRDRKRRRLRSDKTTTHLSKPSSDQVKSKPKESTYTTETTTTIHWSSDPHAHMTNAKVKSILKEGWREISLLDTGRVFETKVTEEIAPNYFDYIRHPMDLGTIHKSIMTNDTYSLHTLDHDIMLMLSNCVKYNSIDNPDLVSYAKDLKSAWIAIRTDILHRITYAEYTSTNSTATIPKDILYPRLRAAWEKVNKQDPTQIFAYPVTDAIAPGYTRMIKEPMDLGTILKKLNKSVYTNLSGFDKDMELIFKNCIQYNGIQSTYGKLAVKLQKVWREQRRFIELESMKSPSSSTLPSLVSTAPELTPVPVKASSSASLNTHKKDISSTSSHTNKTQSSIPLSTDTDIDASTSHKSTKMLSSTPLPSTSTPSAIGKQNIPVIDKAKLSSVLQLCLDKLSSYDTQGIFAFPSDSKSIETPMDLSTMRVKTQKYKYKTMSLFHADVVIMIKNYLSLHADWKKRKYCRDFEEKWEQLYASEYHALYGEYPSEIDATQLLLDKPINTTTGSSHLTALSTVTSTTLKKSTHVPTTIVKLEPGLQLGSTLQAQTTLMKEPVVSEKGTLMSSKEHTIKTDNANLNVVPSSMSIKIKKRTTQVEIKQETAAVSNSSNSSEKDSMIDPKDTQTNISSTTTTTTTSQKLLSDSSGETVHNSDMTNDMKKDDIVSSAATSTDMELSTHHHHQDVIEDKSMVDTIDHMNSIPPSDSTLTTISATPTTTISATPTTTISATPTTTISVTPATTISVTPATTISVTPTTTISVTPATTISVTPATTISVTPATTISVTPATTISVTPKPIPNPSTETHSSINQTTTTTTPSTTQSEAKATTTISSSSSSSPRSSTAPIITTSASTAVSTSQASNKNAALKAMLESTRNAMKYYEKLSYSADKINELPPIYTDGALLWASLLLRDAGLQSACRTYIVNQLKTMITNVLDNTVDNILPHKDMNLSLALQICQLPYSPINQIMGTDQLLLRDVFPSFVIECVMGKEDNYKDVISVMKGMYNFLSDNNLSSTAENKTTSLSSSEASTNIVTSESKPSVPSAVTNQDVTKLMQKQIALTVMSQCIEKLRIK